jgi:hypothetical protein
MNHTYAVEVLEEVDGQLVLIHKTPIFKTNYADARAVLAHAADLAVKAIGTIPWVESVVSEAVPTRDNSIRVSWIGHGTVVTREIDLVRVGD